MDYDVGRVAAIQSAYLGIIKAFMPRYRAGRPTVVMLPGGMGSQLDRSPEPYRGEPPDFNRYDTVWIDLGLIFSSDGLALEIDAHGRDRDGYIVVPNGELRFLVDAYDGTRQWAADSGFNYVVFGYDWRRPIEECAGYLEFFLSNLRQQVFRKHGENPLENATLFAHSQGGLVAQMFLHRVGNPMPWFRRLITVATPLYGTWSHMDRYFVGQSPLNEIYGKRRVAEIIGSLPGPYTLMPVDRTTFARDWQRLGFSSDGDFPLLDSVSGAVADCYDPANRARWPGWCSRDHLDRARAIRQTIALPLPDAVAARIVNIRSTLDSKTPTRQTWAALPDGFDPDGGAASTVAAAGFQGGGDGTVPGWSAWHAYVPPANRLECAQADSHMDMMEHVEVLNMAGPLIDPGYRPVRTADPKGLYGASADRASPGEVKAFAADAGSGRTPPGDPRLYDERIWRGFMREMKR